MTQNPDLSRRRFIAFCAAGATSAALGDFAALGATTRLHAMSHRERIERALRLQETDRLPFGFWWHFPNRDRSPRRLAELSIELQRRLDLDFIKFSPYGLYSVVDWGVTLDMKAGWKAPPVQADFPVKHPADWRKLRPFSPTEGEYLIVLEAQRIALAELAGEVPLVQTVFSPLTSCLKLAGREVLLQHLREAPEAVQAGLEIVTETTRRFAAEVVKRGAAGLFFASQTTNEGYLTPEEYREFATKYDLVVLDAVKGKSWFDLFHLHGTNVMLDQVLDYPVQAFNYHDREGGPPLAEMRTKTDKCLIGGIGQQTTLVHGTPEEVDAQVRDAWEQVHRRGLILGPGCVANLNAPERNVLQLRKSVEATATY
jgi:uroporphyrinogen decarboxylase